MARDGYLILDSDLHMMEPGDLWARYLDEPYRANPPRFFGSQQQQLTPSADDKSSAAKSAVTFMVPPFGLVKRPHYAA